jgi:hypothetical protein
MRRGVATMLALAVLAVALAPISALADGDPASDVLLGENVFYPYSPTVSPDLQQTLNAETAATTRAHYPIKVALIHEPADLGAITTLWGKPQQYANFLDQEISFTATKQRVLVVMPNGYGLRGLGPAAQTAAASLKRPGSGQVDDLARAAIIALPKLTAADGHPISTVAVGSGTGGTHADSVLTAVLIAATAIAAAAIVITVRQRRARAR